MAKYSYVFILTLIFLIMSIATDRFLTVDNLLNVARQSSMLLIMALGMTMAMLLGRGHVYGCNRIHFFLFCRRLLPSKP